MKVASIQIGVVENNKSATIDKAVEGIRKAKGADLIVLPELWNIGFMSFDRYLPEAEDRNGPTLTALRNAAREFKVHLHTGSFVEKEGAKLNNTSYHLSPRGEIQAHYKKIHLFGYNSKETQILTHGNQVVVADTPLGRIGMATCYDLRFPELFRRLVEKGAELFLVCSAWPYPRLEHWIMLNRVRALENQCFLVSSNPTGLNGGSQFAGHSMMVNPWGIILTSGGDDEVVLKADLNLSEVRSARERFPALADRQEWLQKP